jgi:hypothetical protein
MSACCSTYGNVAGAHFDEKIANCSLTQVRLRALSWTLAQVSVD